MCLFLVNLNRMIENSLVFGRGMDEIQFPHFIWQSKTPLEASSTTQIFLKSRPNEHWVLVGEGVAQCHAQLWTAWHSAARRQRRGTSLARSFDAEFLRYLSGTHHVSEAFKRAGLRDGDSKGCFLFLPGLEGSADSLPDVSLEATSSLTLEAASLASSMGLALVEEPLVCHPEGAKRLGLVIEDSSRLTCDALIGHIISAEFNS